jgi:hypothetical protein
MIYTNRNRFQSNIWHILKEGSKMSIFFTFAQLPQLTSLKLALKLVFFSIKDDRKKQAQRYVRKYIKFIEFKML